MGSSLHTQRTKGSDGSHVDECKVHCSKQRPWGGPYLTSVRTARRARGEGAAAEWWGGLGGRQQHWGGLAGHLADSVF